METKWIIKPPIDKKLSDSFPEYSPLVLQLLANRGLATPEAIDEFFNPDYVDHIHDPFLLKGMAEAVERICRAVKDDEKILVYGDYDADGVTAATVMVKTLKFLGVKTPEIYIPDRAKEGYGLKEAAIVKFKKIGVGLIITVDCGIASRKEIDLANDLGLDVIVTDHHWAPDKLPEALAIINPKQKNDPYPFKELAGVGVAFKLAQALLKSANFSPKDEKDKLAFEKWLLDLVAIGTVADSVPLIGENRTLAAYGLIVLGKTKNIGLGEVSRQIKEKKLKKGNGTGTEEKITSDTISFQFAPRINAAGRLDHANTSFALLNTESKKEAQGLAQSLELLNGKRQSLTDGILKEIRKRLGKKSVGWRSKIIFEGDKEWPIGVLGLIAGKLTDEFSRPAFILNCGKKISGGSCRSIPSFNIIEALSQAEKLLEEFGGHKGAAGFKVENKNLEKLRKKLEAIADREIKEEELAPAVEIDAEVGTENMHLDFFREVEKMAPFGEGNPEPVFVLRNMRIAEMRAVGNGEKHLKLSLLPDKNEKGKKNDPSASKIFRAIGFNLGDWSVSNKIKINDRIDIAFTLSVNEWNGYSNLEFKVIDLKVAK